MVLGLKIITFLIIIASVLIVGGTCLGVSLATTIDSINNIGRDWAAAISKSISRSVLNYFEHWEAITKSATTLIKAENLRTPSEEWSINGRNWTDFWVPFMIGLGRKQQFDFSVIGMQFIDYWWMFIAPSRLNASFSSVEWMENLGGVVPPTNESEITAGGIRFKNSDGQPVGYSSASNYQPEIFLSDASLISTVPEPYKFTFQQMINSHPSAKTWCKYFGPLHTFIPERSIYWELYVSCALVNTSVLR